MIDQIVRLQDREEINREIELFGRFLQCLPDDMKTNCPNKHHFCEGVYIREMFIPKGTFIIGKKHKTTHFNIVLSGSGKVICDGVIKKVKQGDIFTSKSDGRKVGIADEDMRFLNIFPTSETNIDKLDEELAYDESDVRSFTGRAIRSVNSKNI